MLALYHSIDGYRRTCTIITHANLETTQNRSYILVHKTNTSLWVEQHRLQEYDENSIDTDWIIDEDTVSE